MMIISTEAISRGVGDTGTTQIVSILQLMGKTMLVKSMFWVKLETKVIPVSLSAPIYPGGEENKKSKKRNLEVASTKENGISFYGNRNPVSLDLTCS
ncbi:hypothetical protein MiSe_13980 [Microseira wollei NIES-4236]|uniref:Transposase n=1 Tax=Microseira wollei NIES-4236 TaxID=2530354 RepID=A0AAV3X5Z0_9CYAN|nr:hypothetical protein MiSe_13980 [Microseira wollei NIES-4236]